MIEVLSSNPSSCARHIVRPHKPKHRSVEQKRFIAGPSKGKGGLGSKDPNSQMVFRKKFLKATFGVTAAGLNTTEHAHAYQQIRTRVDHSIILLFNFYLLFHSRVQKFGEFSSGRRFTPGWGTKIL